MCSSTMVLQPVHSSEWKWGIVREYDEYLTSYSI
nr:MAG TPA: hypothetical protein [Caudoviricetes sp.]